MIKNIYQIIFCAIILIIFINAAASASQRKPAVKNPIIIQSGKDEYNLDKHISVLIDKTGKLNIEDVSSDSFSKKFVKINTESPNYGYDNSVYWVRFSVFEDNNISKDHNNNFNDKWMLINKYPGLEDVRLYYRDSYDSNYVENKAGLIAFHKTAYST